MLIKPRFKHSLVVEICPDALFVLDEQRQWVFEGEVYQRLAPLLDGQHTVTDLIGALAEHVSFPDLYAALMNLTHQGCLVEGGEPASEHAAFWEHFDAAGAAHRLGDTTVSVRAVGEVDASPVAEALR